MQSAVILIVEDERLVARDLADVLTQQGYTVPDICVTAESALAQIEQEPPDLVLMDIYLAGEMDGITAAAMIQSQFHLPVVYLTANADRATIDRMRAMQPFGYILKPFDEVTLFTTIDIARSRHQAEAEIRTVLQQTKNASSAAQDLVDSKLNYFAKAAHELRNPLSVIQAVAELLSMKDLDITPERRERYLQRMQAATSGLDELLNSILTYSYSSAGKLDSHPKPIDLVGFCQEQINLLKASIAPQHIVHFKPQGPKCMVYLDDQLLWHLVTNVLSNAIKYSATRSDGDGIVRLDLSWNEQQVNLTISDNGIGIPSNAIAQVFEPFYRADNATEISGSGLGLALAQECAQRLSGTITIATPSPGALRPDTLSLDTLSGTCVKIELPRRCIADCTI